MTAREAIDQLESAARLLESYGIQSGDIYEGLQMVIRRMEAIYAGRMEELV